MSYFKKLKERLYFLKVWYNDLFLYPREELNLNDSLNYDKYWYLKRGKMVGVLSGWQKDRADIILKVIDLKTPISIGDIGCGDGSILKYLKDKLNIIRAIGYDSSDFALKKARKIGIETTKFDINKDRFERIEETDYILLLEILEHIPNSETLLRAAYDKSQKGVFFSIPNSGFFIHRLRLLLGRFPKQWTRFPNEHLRFWTLKDLKWWLKSLRYDNFSVFYYRGIPILNQIWPGLFSAGFLVFMDKYRRREELLKLLDRSVASSRKLLGNTWLSRLERIFRYPHKIFLRRRYLKRLSYGHPLTVKTVTFFGKHINTLDTRRSLGLCGVIDDQKEVNLAKFLIKNLKSGDIFFDVGAHHGYYTLLADYLMLSEGEIHAFEPSPLHFKVLKSNSKGGNIKINNVALYSESTELVFHENLREGSTIDVNFFRQVKGFRNSKFRVIKVPAITLDRYCFEKKVVPTIIKIDVEGAEFHVLRGGELIFRDYNPLVIMEIWAPPLEVTPHLQAIEFLRAHGYSPWHLTSEGEAIPIKETEFTPALLARLARQGSDNILFKKSIHAIS